MQLLEMFFLVFFNVWHAMMTTAGSARWDEKKEDGWKERMEDWKLQQGNLGPEPDEDPDAAMYASCTTF